MDRRSGRLSSHTKPMRSRKDERARELAQHREPFSMAVNADEEVYGVFTDMDSFGEGLDTEGPQQAQEKKVDADFFNAFGDVFDEDDMKPSAQH